MRARELWEQLAGRVPGTGFRAARLDDPGCRRRRGRNCSARPPDARRGGARVPAARRGGRTPRQPGACGASSACGLLGRQDAIVEPRQVPDAIRDYLLASGTSGEYAWLPGREAVEIAPGAVRDQTGAWHRGDLVVLCTGAAHTGLAGPHLSGYDGPAAAPGQAADAADRAASTAGSRPPSPTATRCATTRRTTCQAAPGCCRSRRPRRPPPRSCCWRSGSTAASRSGIRTPTTSRSPSTWTRRPTITCGPGPSTCSGRRCRRPGGAGPASTARSPAPRSTTARRSRRASSWLPAPAGVA